MASTNGKFDTDAEDYEDEITTAGEDEVIEAEDGNNEVVIAKDEVIKAEDNAEVVRVGNGEDKITEDLIDDSLLNWPEVEVESDANYGFSTENASLGNAATAEDYDFEDYSPTWATGRGVQVPFNATNTWAGVTNPSTSELTVVCSEAGFQIALPSHSSSEMKVLSPDAILSLKDAPESCGYESPAKNTLTIPFNGCHVNINNGSYAVQILYTKESGYKKVTAICDAKANSGLMPRVSGSPAVSPRCLNTNPQNCAIPMEERLICGHVGISPAECQKKGCCADSARFSCYYPVDECMADGYIVFAIRHNSAPIPVDPTKLVIPGAIGINCKPVLVNKKFAVFKFKVSECGTHAFEIGDTKVYLAEVQTIVHALNLKYGMITRTDPLRFLVECRYSKGFSTQSIVSIGYVVNAQSTPLPSKVVTNSLYGVELRMATDHTYTRYFPTNHQPLQLLLGRPIFLELRLKSPKLKSPKALVVILVNYCVAYTRSATNALVLIYEGCANPHDQSVSILKVSGLAKFQHVRRFVVWAFQFMNQRTNKYLNEEVSHKC
ncbi:zona pellucida sperm-binding protein 4-like [Thalassophryne amazonica]|uniref:zona pellucida sperm-binding protein 4-like n=1 Tax=Thalassophryne amazonica TaxID=390379 RepID=UPI00147181A7|nr:zona pellucida sperm-binding protein 4-like [Thalassophryne amazonica]